MGRPLPGGAVTRARPIVLSLVWLLAATPTAAAEQHYDIRLSLDPRTRIFDAEVGVKLPATADGRFGFGRGFLLQALSIDGQVMDPAAGSWPVATGRPITIRYRAQLPTLAEAQASATLTPFADGEGSFLPLIGWHPGLASGAFTYTVTIDVPAGQRAVAAGRMTEEREADGRYVVRFAFDKPARELSVFVGPYVVGETRHGDLRFRTYFPAGMAALGERYRRQVATYIDAFSAWIGPYPHGEFHVVASPLAVGLGFPTLTYVSQRILPLPFMQERSLAHEVLHAWWGHGVQVDYRHGNWSEALTTFMADYALAETAGEDAARDMRRRWLADYAVLPPSQDRELMAFVTRQHTASQVIGYNKGAMLFLMLRDEIGFPAFAAGIRRLWRDRQFQSASWDDWRAAFAAEAGRPLDDFFRQWLERAGAPMLSLADAGRLDGNRVGFTLTQAGVGDGEPYRLAVPVSIETARGPERHMVRLDDARQTYALSARTPVTGLRVDPDYRLFRRLHALEVAPIIRGLVAAANPATVIAGAAPEVSLAAGELAAGLLENSARPVDLDQAIALKQPMLLVGTRAAVGEAIGRANLPPRSARLAESGTGAVWAARLQDNVPMLVVEADDAVAIRQMAPAIRHHGASSYLIFDGGRVTERGVWPPAARPLDVEFKD
ncbi:MAG: M1 family peptidase [Alphaproteobacteria bacterium]|nr:M1 family peptidase [Alphaproteobacteria bacterium]